MTEWKAEMPEVHGAHVATCDAMAVRRLVDAANEELAKVRAERDEARAEVQALGALGPQIHSVAAMHFEACSERDAALARVRNVEALLSLNGCDCDCDHSAEEHDEDCDRCFACQVQAALDGKDRYPLPEPPKEGAR